MAGNGTIGLEILEDLPDVDAILVPYGGGGLITGIASAVKATRPEVRMYAVEPETGAPAASALHGGPHQVDYARSFVDGAGSRSLIEGVWDHAHALIDDAFTVPLDDAAAAIRLIAERASGDRRGRRSARDRRRARGEGRHRKGRLRRLGREHRPARLRPHPRRGDALMATTSFDVEAARARFSSLRSGFAFLDAPGGTQVPDEVGDAIAAALRDASGNLGAPYATGRAVEAILDGREGGRGPVPGLHARPRSPSA